MIRKQLKLFSLSVKAFLLLTGMLFSFAVPAKADFIINGGTVTVADNTTLTVDNMILTQGQLSAGYSQIIVGSTWTRSGGSFNYGTSSVTFAGTGPGTSSGLIGSNTFYRLIANQPGSRVRFTAGTTQYITTRLTLEDVNLRSTINNATWYLVLSGPNQNVNGVNVRDSNASGGNAINATNSFNAGNNTNWNFIVTDTGDRYWIATAPGNWNDSANWSLSNGGSGGAQVPLSTHTVIFNSIGTGVCTVNTAIVVSTLNVAAYTGTLNTQGNAVTILKRFEQTSGTVNWGASTITIQGTFERSGGSFLAGVSTFIFSGNQTQTLISGATGFNHVVVNKSGGTLTLSDELDVLGNLSLIAGSFDSGSQPISIAGDWTRAGGTFTGDNSMVTFDGSDISRLTGETTFYALRAVTPSNTLEFSAGTTFYVTDTLDLQDVILKSSADDASWHLKLTGANQTVLNVNVRDSNASRGNTIGANSLSVNSGNNQNWAFGDTTRYWVSTATGNWNSAANWALSGGGSGGASVPTSTHTVIFDGTNGANGEAKIYSALNLSTVIVSGYTGIINTQGYAITISSAFAQDSGLVAIGTSIVTMQGDMIRTGGSFATGISTIQFTGDKIQTLTAGATAFYHVNVNKTGGSVTLGSDLRLSGQLTVTAGTFDTDSANSYASSSTLVNIQASGIFNANNSTVTLTGIGGILFTKVGAYNYGNSKVIFKSNAGVTLTANNPITLHHLELSPLLTANRIYTLGTNPLTINGNLDVLPDAASTFALNVSLGSSTVVLGTTTLSGTGVALSSITTSATNRAFTSGNLYIGADCTFVANASSITLNGSSGPLITALGRFDANTSHLRITSDADVTVTNGNIALATVTFSPEITSDRTYSFGSGIISISSSFLVNPIKSTVGDATLTVTMGNRVNVASTALTTINGTTNAYSHFDTGAHHPFQTGRLAIYGNGTFTANNSTITFIGTSGTMFTRTGTFNKGYSNVVMQSNAGITLTSNNYMEFYNLTLSPNLSTGRIYTFGTSSMTISNELDINPSGAAAALTVNLGSSTVVMGTTTVQGSGSAISNLSTVASWPLTTANLNIVSGSSLTANAATITLNGTSSPLLTRTGSFLPGTSTVDIESDADVIITNSSMTFNNLIMTSTITADRNYFLGAGSMTVAGNFTISPVKSDAGIATLTVNLGNTLTVGAARTLLIDGTANAYSTFDTTINDYPLLAGKINIQANGTVRVNGSSVTLTGTTATLLTNNGTFEPGTSSVIMNPNATINPATSGSITFYDLSLTPPNSANISYTFGTSSLTINRHLNINPAPTGAFVFSVNLGSSTVVVGTTTLTRSTANGSSSMTVTSNNYPFQTGHLNITANGAFTAWGSSITFTGTTSPLITRAGTFVSGTSTVAVTCLTDAIFNSGTITLNHFYIDTPNQILSLGAATTVNQRLTIQEGTLDDNGAQIAGNAANKLVMQPGTALILGNDGTATTFPTNYTNTNILLADGSTVTYNSGQNQTVSGTPTYADLKLVAPSGTPTKTAGAAVTVAGHMDIGANNTYSVSASNFALTVGGNYNNDGTFTANGSTVTFNAGTAGNILSGNLTGASQFQFLTFNGLNGAWSNTSAMTVASTLTVTAGTLSGSNDITVNGGVVGNGTNGAINLTAGTFTQRIANNQRFGTNIAGSNDWTFNNLTFSNSSAVNRTIVSTGPGTGSIVVNGTLSVGNGADSNTTTIANSTGTGNRFFDLNSDLNITTRGIFQASSMTALNVGGNWTNNGTFTLLKSTVIFDGSGIQTLIGATTFYGLRATTPGGTLRLTAGTTFYATNMVEFQNITLESTAGGSPWHFKYTGSSQTLLDLNVQDSNASSGSLMQAFNSTSNGNNTNWDFGLPNAITNLTALLSPTGGAIDLTWTSPGDDGAFGTLANSTYTIQYTTDTAFAQSSNWSPTAAPPSYVYRVNIPTTSVTPGTTQGVSLTGLTGGSTYYFRTWTKDDVGNYSLLSNGATNWITFVILSVDVSPSSFGFGQLPVRSTGVASSSITVTNSGNGVQKYSLQLSNPAGWTAVTTPPATDEYRFSAVFSNTIPTVSSFTATDVVTTGAQTATSSIYAVDADPSGGKGFTVPVGTTRGLWFQFESPTLNTVPTQQMITITITAISD